ncbi:hypothetical protein [Tautonia marina]|uniref:hypothetical protein n=1 Tax=Tautonia marina TaxID=2653855 RepID=UPI001260E480|nr:hypothetical protein [Tautonia marina]
MNRHRIAILVLGFGLLAPADSTPAQEQERSTALEQLRSLDPMAGAWRRETEQGDGNTLISTTIIRWTADEAFLRMTSWESVEGSSEPPRNLGTTLVGWDPEANRLGVWAFHHLARLTGPATIADGSLTLELTGELLNPGDGSSEASTTVSLECAEDRLTASYSGTRLGDQALGDMTLVSTRWESAASASSGDDSWKARQWEELTGNWRADLPNGGYRIKRITEGEEILETYNPQGELAFKTRCDMAIERHEGIAFFTVTNRVRLDSEPPTPVPGSYTSIYKIHDGKWYDQLRGIFAEAGNLAPDRFLVYSQVDESGTLVADAPAQSVPPLALVRVEYMSVPEGGDEAYLQTERVWKRIQAARRTAGGVDHWAVYRVDRKHNKDSDYNYAVVHVFHSPDQIRPGFNYAELIDSLEWSDEERAILEKTNETRELVRSDRWAIEIAVDSERLKNPAREPGTTLVIGRMTSTDPEEHLRLEKDYWSRLWAERVRGGELQNWLLMSRRSGSGPNMLAVHVAPDQDAPKRSVAELERVAFPEADPEELRRQVARTPEVRDWNGHEVWTLVECLDPIGED